MRILSTILFSAFASVLFLNLNMGPNESPVLYFLACVVGAHVGAVVGKYLDPAGQK